MENGLIRENLFFALVIMAIITGMSSGPLMRWSLGNKKMGDGLFGQVHSNKFDELS